MSTRREIVAACPLSDVGESVRTEAESGVLAHAVVRQVQSLLSPDLYRIPDTNLIMECAP
jgi:hypothetical protein